MDHFAGLDVSVKETSICIVDEAGKIVREVKVVSEPEALLAVLKNPAYLSLPKIRSVWIRSMSQNHRIIRADVCDPARAVDLRCRHFQVATQAASREPISSSSA